MDAYGNLYPHEHAYGYCNVQPLSQPYFDTNEYADCYGNRYGDQYAFTNRYGHSYGYGVYVGV